MNSTELFIQKSRKVHRDKYDYSKVKYINNHTKVTIICFEHGDFDQLPTNHYSLKQGCPKCGTYESTKKQRLDFNTFVERSQKVHGNKYDYSKGNFKGVNHKITIICPDHGEFYPTPYNHYSNKSGCPKCYQNTKFVTQQDFIKKATLKHGNKYDYSKVRYSHSKIKVTIICKQHGEFKQQPAQHLFGNGCPKCNPHKASNKSIQWLKYISKKENIYIQHAENEGEYKIPNTLYKADGYCKQNNTIYEFHGNRFHGNPNMFESADKCHPYDRQITAGELYNQTLRKECVILQLGYNLVTIWETDFDQILLQMKQSENISD